MGYAPIGPGHVTSELIEIGKGGADRFLNLSKIWERKTGVELKRKKLRNKVRYKKRRKIFRENWERVRIGILGIVGERESKW